MTAAAQRRAQRHQSARVLEPGARSGAGADRLLQQLDGGLTAFEQAMAPQGDRQGPLPAERPCALDLVLSEPARAFRLVERGARAVLCQAQVGGRLVPESWVDILFVKGFDAGHPIVYLGTDDGLRYVAEP